MELGKIAYEAFWGDLEDTGVRWEDQTDAIKERWEEAGAAVANYLERAED